MLPPGGLGGGRRREGVGMDLDQREVPEREADATGSLPLDLLDLAVCLPRVGAFVVAVLDDQGSSRRATDVIGGVERL